MSLLLFLTVGCAQQAVFDTPIAPDDTFERVPATGALLERYEAAAAYSEAHDGRALLILKGDEVVFETGQNGHTLDEPHHLFSGTKSFSCGLFAAAVEDGHMAAEERVRPTLPELPDAADDLTVDHLLHLTSGMHQAFHLTRDALRAEQRVDDKYAATLDVRWKTPPGETFEYGTSHFNVFGAFAGRKTGEDPLDYLRRRVLDPIGFRDAGWIRDPAGNPMFSFGAWTTVNEWAKYGALVRDDGVFLGERVLPEGALHGCFEGSPANGAYGRTFWLNRDPGDDVDLIAPRRLEPDGPLLWNDGPTDLVAAAGHDDQRLYIVPSQDLVVVRLAEGSWTFKDRELLRLILD